MAGKAPSPDELGATKISMRIYCRVAALERAIQACGTGALPAQILEYADRFYPFIAQEILKEGE
jgi:hypothetical protein